MPVHDHDGKSGRAIPARAAFRVVWLLTLFMTEVLHAQTKCPSLPEGTVCDHYHYHVLVWQPHESVYQEVAATRQFVSREACEKWRAEAAKENQSTADYLKTSRIVSSMQADTFGECHCDRTTETSSGVFLDAKARVRQQRVGEESVWDLRERLLSSDLPTAGEYIRSFFGKEPQVDRMFRETLAETVPARLPEKTARAAAAALRETKIGGASNARPVALDAAFVEIPSPAAEVPLSVEQREDLAKATDLGRRFFEAGDFAKALMWFDSADSILRDQPALLYDMALSLVKLQRYDEAQRRIDRYLALYPQGHEYQAAKALQREVQFRIEVEKGNRQDNKYKTLFSEAKALYKKGLRREALAAFREAGQIYPDDPPLILNEAVLSEEDGALEDALRSYKRYLQLIYADAPEFQPRIDELETEIVDMRTKLMCPVCGVKLPAGARWCHRCWHGPYDVTSAAWNARACDSHATVVRSIQDVNGKTRVTEPALCLFPGRSLRDFLQYNQAGQSAVLTARAAEGWSFSKEGLLQSRRGASGVELTMQQGDHLQQVVNQATGEAFPYKGHATADGIWLLDAQPYSTGDQLFFITRSFDSDGRVRSEEVTYDSAACRHGVSYVATYTYEGDLVVAGQIKGGYDGYRVEGFPQVRWEVAMTRKFDANARLVHEELAVTSFQKTYKDKPRGTVSDEVRRVYQNLKAGPKAAPLDIRATGDVCGFVSPDRVLDEAIDLRPLFVVSPAVAVRLSPRDNRVAVDYAYSDK